jgi:hypothetical protein
MGTLGGTIAVRAHLSLGRWPALAALLLVACGAAWGKVTVEETEYKGWKKNLRIRNGAAELIVTLDVGPRVISYRLAGGKNVFKEYADQLGKTGEPDWQIRGGHRLWVGPEDLTRTYAPDNGPVKYKVKEDGSVRLRPAPDKKYGIQKEMVVTLAPDGTGVTVVHRLRNIGKKKTRLAPWALTVMAPGGVEVIPLPPKRPHPGPPKNARSPEDYAADQNMALWPFFDFTDKRWTFGSRYITLRHDANKGPTKIGLAHRMGWVGHLNGGTLFIKRIPYVKGKRYPDNGSNFETFTNQDMVEVESLGLLVRLAPRETAEHVEHWELVGGLEDFKDEAGIDKNVRSKVKTK